jgi:hypothetical protein
MSDNDIQVEPAEVLNRKLLDAISAADEGYNKAASDAASNMIRRKLRENGFSRSILPYKQVSNDDLSYLPDTELPVIVEEMEPESPGAKSVTFNDTADTEFYRMDKFVVYFAKIVTPEFTKNVEELRTYKSDLRGVITDNALKDIQTEEDGRFIKTIDRVTGDYGGTGQSGVQQAFNINSAITRDSYVEILSHLENQRLNNGVFLMNRKTAKAFLKFDRSEVGGELSQELFKDGLTALNGGTVMGIRHIFTIKDELIPNQEVYQFAEPSYLGRAYVLQNVTMYVEKKKDILRFSAMEKIGLTIANVAGCARSKFTS